MPSSPFTTLVDVTTLRAYLDDPRWRVVDCRFSLARPEAGGEAYAAGHVPGAVYAHLERDLSGPLAPGTGRHPLPAPEALADTVADWGIDAATQVVVYDDGDGAMASRLWWMLRWLGHEAVAALDGGWTAWQEAGAPISAQPARFPRADFRARVVADAYLATDQVQGALAEQRIVLVDARGAARFRGDEEPIDPVAGHVPGATNRPYTRNLDARGRFRPAQQLREELEQELQGRSAEDVVHMCGSGVTACHNLLAMELAGLSGSRLYPGSWSEWIRDPGRGVAVGAA